MDGVKSIFNKIEAINSFPKPTHLRGLLRFFGMLKYYPRFIPDCAKILRPLNNMLLSKKAFVWLSHIVFLSPRIRSNSMNSILTCYRKYGITLQKDKCAIAMAKVTFLSRVINNGRR